MTPRLSAAEGLALREIRCCTREEWVDHAVGTAPIRHSVSYVAFFFRLHVCVLNKKRIRESLEGGGSKHYNLRMCQRER